MGCENHVQFLVLNPEPGQALQIELLAHLGLRFPLVFVLEAIYMAEEVEGLLFGGGGDLGFDKPLLEVALANEVVIPLNVRAARILSSEDGVGNLGEIFELTHHSGARALDLHNRGSVAAVVWLLHIAVARIRHDNLHVTWDHCGAVAVGRVPNDKACEARAEETCRNPSRELHGLALLIEVTAHDHARPRAICAVLLADGGKWSPRRGLEGCRDNLAQPRVEAHGPLLYIIKAPLRARHEAKAHLKPALLNRQATVRAFLVSHELLHVLGVAAVHDAPVHEERRVDAHCEVSVGEEVGHDARALGHHVEEGAYHFIVVHRWSARRLRDFLAAALELAL
mmetsp:Transcript_1892/g.5310  ORF Transcript_1892/g.5310 Transcript_1892/m.5310 type:complete len:339 (+) Transcript_1892:574-1590(+)